MKILAIETSCDETGISILSQDGQRITLLGNALASQIDLHAQYGGVFPAMAKRAHAEKIVPLLKDALLQAGVLINKSSVATSDMALTDTVASICNREDEMVSGFVDLFNTYEKPDIDYIAVTVGPGLEPALWVGINAAKVLSKIWDIPVIPVNHMEGHVVTAAVIEFQASLEAKQEDHIDASGERLARTKDQQYGLLVLPPTKSYLFKELEFPLLALLVSGGHTELVLTKSYGEYEKIGQTRDDAVGEAFDKVARMIGLPYPGGPAVSKLAREFRLLGIENKFEFPRPMMHSGDYDFSFSGLKTAVLYTIRDLVQDPSTTLGTAPVRDLTEAEKQALACAFEDAAIDVLTKKTMRAIEEFGIQTVVVGGGVSGNTYLKEQLTARVAKKLPGVVVLFPEPWLATDNAVMIGLAAFARIQSGSMTIQPAETLKANGNLSIAQ
ncbi:MAG: tRNA (adenosine(37)-N6)-threonylcarbamoyltransferase complex transferase subunit TsaD [Candidatus Paceibacterota bacterium]